MWDEAVEQVMALIMACSGGSDLPISLFLMPKAENFGLIAGAGSPTASHWEDCTLPRYIQQFLPFLLTFLLTYLYVSLAPLLFIPSPGAQAVGRAITVQ